MTPRFQPVPLVGAGKALLADAEQWITSPPIRALITAFGGDPCRLDGPLDQLDTRLGYAGQFTDRWDTRQGRERNQADELELTTEQQELIVAATDALGYRGGTRLRFTHYDHVLILGGLIRACLSRPAHAADLLTAGTITADNVTALGGHRPFTGNEFDQAAAAGLPELTEEYEALDQGMRIAFDLGHPTHIDGEQSTLLGGTWGVRHYRTDDGTIRVAAAPSSDPENRRADTPDTYAFFAERLAPLQPQQRLLMITTQIYVPPQHLAALTMLTIPYGVEVDTIGTPPPAPPADTPPAQSPTKYLLEIRATIRALRSLIATITKSQPNPAVDTGGP
ncbi:MAG TPA: hypothetical protein VGJ13_07840 [Pseudonocardiaceae bacterium]|jgi:hypothetical protein